MLCTSSLHIQVWIWPYSDTGDGTKQRLLYISDFAQPLTPQYHLTGHCANGFFRSKCKASKSQDQILQLRSGTNYSICKYSLLAWNTVIQHIRNWRLESDTGKYHEIPDKTLMEKWNHCNMMWMTSPTAGWYSIWWRVWYEWRAAWSDSDWTTSCIWKSI